MWRQPNSRNCLLCACHSYNFPSLLCILEDRFSLACLCKSAFHLRSWVSMWFFGPGMARASRAVQTVIQNITPPRVPGVSCSASPRSLGGFLHRKVSGNDMMTDGVFSTVFFGATRSGVWQTLFGKHRLELCRKLERMNRPQWLAVSRNELKELETMKRWSLISNNRFGHFNCILTFMAVLEHPNLHALPSRRLVSNALLHIYLLSTHVAAQVAESWEEWIREQKRQIRKNHIEFLKALRMAWCLRPFCKENNWKSLEHQLVDPFFVLLRVPRTPGRCPEDF